jgi:ABC-type branched-subunit amino acid transport system substrate-binding protein
MVEWLIALNHLTNKLFNEFSKAKGGDKIVDRTEDQLKFYSLKKGKEIMFAKNIWSKIFVHLFVVVLIAGFSSMANAATIKVGALNDMTGATSDVGKDYALGISDAIHYVNDNGGINGKEIKLYQFDYGYRIPEALTKYKLFKRLN